MRNVVGVKGHETLLRALLATSVVALIAAPRLASASCVPGFDYGAFGKIRRFIDPRARFTFVAANGYVPIPGELRFDMFDAEFTHVGDRCSFEVLVERTGLADPALVAIGEIIHDLDLRDGKFGREETPGVRSAIDGICTVSRGDDDRIAAASPMLDGLHSHFAIRARRGRRG